LLQVAAPDAVVNADDAPLEVGKESLGHILVHATTNVLFTAMAKRFVRLAAPTWLQVAGVFISHQACLCANLGHKTGLQDHRDNLDHALGPDLAASRNLTDGGGVVPLVRASHALLLAASVGFVGFNDARPAGLPGVDENARSDKA
jgi:hypothetical protein